MVALQSRLVRSQTPLATATDVVSEASDAVADTTGAIGDVIDPAAWQDIESNWDEYTRT